MARMNWARARAWKPREEAFPRGRLGDPMGKLSRNPPGEGSQRRRAVLEVVHGSVPAPTPPGAVLRTSDTEQAGCHLAKATTAQVYCDGGCMPNPGTGGWGIVICSNVGQVELSGGERRTTNNRMELMGAIEALAALPHDCRCEIISDSRYLVDGITKWIMKWKRKSWTRNGEPIANCDLWRRLDALAAGRPIVWRWVRGHSGNPGNQRADRLAESGRLMAAAE